MQQWEYLTTYISGALEFPEEVGRDVTLDWASKSISQQINAIAMQGWELIDLRWVTDIELMVTFKRAVPDNTDDTNDGEDEPA